MHLFAEALEIQARTAEIYRRFGGLPQMYRDASPSQRVKFALAQKAVEQGETVFLSYDLQVMLFDQSATMPGNWRLTPESLPWPMAFVVIEYHGKESLCIGWVRSEEIAVTYFTVFHTADQPGYYYPVATLFWPDFDELNDIQEYDLIFDNERDRPMAQALADLVAPFLATFFQFLRQELLTPSRQVAPRSTQRRLRRTFDHAPVVQVIALRRKRYASSGATLHQATEREYSCQWLVSGHWRQQWYPSLDTHQPKWIAPYVKGPEDKPLKPPRAKVFAVVR